MPPFSFSTFGTLITEFQKYLSNRIPKAIYFSLGLVVVVLGIISGYIIGWGTIEKDWNGTSPFYQVVLSIVVVIVFFIVAYALGSLQGSIERLFQGEWPLGMGKWSGQHYRHRAIWRERNESWHQMSILRDVIKSMYDQAIHWGQVRPMVVQTKQALPRYYVISDPDEDLMTTFVDTAPVDGALQNLDDAKGMMIQRPLAKEVAITYADLVSLPQDFNDIKIVPITLLAEAVPVGLVPGDRVNIYDRSNDQSSPNSLEDAILIEVEPMSRSEPDGAQLDVVRLTLATRSQTMNRFITLPNSTSDNRLCAVLCPPKTSNRPTVKKVSSMQSIDIPKCIYELLDADEKVGKKKIYFIWRDKPWRKVNNVLNWEDVDGDEELVVAFNCLVVNEGGGKLSVPADLVDRFPRDTADNKEQNNDRALNLEKLPTSPDAIPSSWGSWEAKKVVIESIPVKYMPAAYSKFQGAESWDSQNYAAAGFIMTKTEKESVGEYTPESYFGVTGLICKIEPKIAKSQNDSKSIVTFLVGKDEKRVSRDLYVFDMLLYSNLAVNMTILNKNIQTEPKNLSIYSEIPQARSYLIDMATALVLLDLIRHPAEVSNQHEQNFHAWQVQIDDCRKRLMHILKEKLTEIEYRLDQSHKWFQLYYPANEPAIAPTAIGNVIHAVDSYCQNVYGLDTALVLPRLQAVMEPGTRKQLSTAHDQLALIEWIFIAITILNCLGTLIAISTLHYSLAVILWLLIIPSWFVLQKAALAAALDYASVLRLAYERERGKVITMSGFSLPASQDEEKALWERVQQWWEYGKPPGSYTIISGGVNENN